MTDAEAADAAAGPVVRIPADALVVLIGASGAGKSTFAARLFLATEVVSSDALRGMIADDEAALEATDAAFDLLHEIAAHRLARQRLTVIDATNASPTARRALIALARRHGRPAVAVVLHPPLGECLSANIRRPGRTIPSAAVRAQHRAVDRSRTGLLHEGFTFAVELRSAGEIATTSVRRIDPRAPRAAGGAPGLRVVEARRKLDAGSKPETES